MKQKLELQLVDKTWLEGTTLGELDDYMTETGIWVENAHHSVGAETIPLGKRVFVPYSAIFFLVIEK